MAKEQKTESKVHKPRPDHRTSTDFAAEYHPDELEQAVQRARDAPSSLSSQDISFLQQTIGNQSVGQLLQAKDTGDGSHLPTIHQHASGAGPQVQLAEDLTSPRFASDSTLQDINDGSGTLKEGDEGASVRKVQHAIHDAGVLFLGHGTDGKFGPETTRRVSRFQRRNGISSDPTGEVGAATIGKLDELFPAMALPSTAGDPYTFDGMKAILCQWNSAMIQDLQNLRVIMVASLEWADEEFDGTGWVEKPMSGAGETEGHTIRIATDDTNENVAKTLYHEYQHARSPYAYRTRDWADEESRVYEMETYWAIARGLTPDPGLTTTDPDTGEVEVDESGVTAQVESYPGLDAANPGEVEAKVGTNRVRVRMPDGSVRVRNAVAGDSVPGPRRTTSPRHRVRDAEWCC